MNEETNLAEKYRPKKFGDIFGQPKADTWFRKQVISREGRSVLLSGPHGTGKTSLGLLYAKALFCLGPKMGNPAAHATAAKSSATSDVASSTSSGSSAEKTARSKKSRD